MSGSGEILFCADFGFARDWLLANNRPSQLQEFSMDSFSER